MHSDVPVIEMDDVVFRYFEKGKRNIIDHASMKIYEGITVIAGAGGCGKSTLAAVISGLYPENGGYLESGKILLYGHDLQSLNAQKRAAYLSVLFQNPSLQFCMDTLRHEMEFCLENICVPQSEMSEKIERACEVMHVKDLMDRKFQSLSGGEMQRAELACLFLIGSRCIIMDEPFANIDEDGAREIIQMMLEMAEQGSSFLVIDHRMDYWLSHADEIILLGEGARVLKRGITKQNYKDSADLIRENGLFFPGITSYQRVSMPAASACGDALKLQNVTIWKTTGKRYRGIDHEDSDILLNNVTASFPKGQMSAVIGHSGAGKTTMFLAMLGQHDYDGKILYGDREQRQFRKNSLYQLTGIVFQNPANQFITQKVHDEVEKSLQIWQPQMKQEESDHACAALLKEYGLERYERFSPYMLSQGQQRRLAVLSVLCSGQKILLLDEPTYGQDFRSTSAIMEQLEQKISEEGLTVIFITHDRMLADAYADRIYQLEEKTLKRIRG